MRLHDGWAPWHLEELLEGYLPDFILAFAFFTSVLYAMLGKRFEQQRPAIAMSVAIGFALSIGLVWWEQANRFSIKNLGPIAVGFAILLLAFIMYQSVRMVGGSWAGAGITLGLAIIIAHILGFPVPVAAEILQTLIVVALIIGLMAFVSHRHQLQPRVRPPGPKLPDIKKTMADLYRQRHLSKDLDHGLRRLRKEAQTLHEHPQEASNVMLQIKRMLPAEGYLTERMAQLRAKAHQIRNGHIARLDETRHILATLPTPAKKKAATELAAGYNQIIGIDTRLERLDRAVAENERRIHQLTKKTQEHATRYDHRGIVDCLKHAEKLQKHNSHLFKIIERTEAKLIAVAKQVADRAKQVEKE